MTAPPISGSTSRTYRKVIDALPESMRGEVIAGSLVVMPRPAPAHAQVIRALGGVLGARDVARVEPFEELELATLWLA